MLKTPPDSPDSPEAGAYPFSFHRLDVSAPLLDEINAMLDWRAGTLLNGRLLGRLGVTTNKRTEPGAVPDPRITRLHGLLNLTGKSVLEVGCFEGIHTLGLRLFTSDVTAIDIRPSNIVKTLTRLSLHGADAKVFLKDVESLAPDFGSFDLVFHCGVLYHLMSPVEHLAALGSMCRYLFLDTHIAKDEAEIVERRIGEFSFRGAYYNEAGWLDPFSGKDPKSIWLTRDSLHDALIRAGFTSVNILEEREERNGPRLALLASR